MKKLIGFVGAGAVAAGVLGGAIFATTGSIAPTAIQQVAETEQAAPALSCDTVRGLDKAAQARGVTPGPEQWPPTQPGFERDAPRPEPPIDPSTGKPKGGDVAPLSLEEVDNSPDMGERPCGEVVEKIRASTVQGGGWICYLEDGRYASTLHIDAPKPIETREQRDNACRTFGFARSVQ
ncbi:hypothetical protein GEO20_16390 [Rhodococcus erythropolis]|uniref:hypothetical protein n=1 Tax=Rhodococcus erythropolis TaxID=1833 RepID=UPI0012919411|nr:hypothetical protein [Rhodococcus erythropolis]MQP33539.1 hypothetical protein [Rhodococcus erythropolis]